MKRCVVAFVLVALLTSVAQAEDTIWKEFSKVLVGDWTAKGVISAEGDGGPLKQGDAFTMRGSFRGVAGGKAVTGTQVLTTVDRPTLSFDCTVTFGWDPVKNAVEVDAYWSEGAVERITLNGRKDDAFIGQYTILLPTGKKETSPVAFEVVNDDKFVWRFTGGPHAGKALSTWQRKMPATALSIDLVQYYSYFVGEWKVTSDDVEGEEGVFIVKLGPSGKCHVTEFRFADQRGEAVYGPDPLTGRWTGTGFEADGTFWQGVFSPPSGNQLKPGDSFASHNARKTPVGVTVTDVTTVTIVDKDTFTSGTPEATFRFTRK